MDARNKSGYDEGGCCENRGDDNKAMTVAMSPN